MDGAREMSAAETELDRNEVVRICLRYMVATGGSATTAELYAAVEASMGGATLSPNGRVCVREYVNRYAVCTGLVLPYSQAHAGWRITAVGCELVAAEEHVVDPEPVRSSPMSGALEQYVLGLMRLMYPSYVWCQQGVDTRYERGLDLIGTWLPAEAPPMPLPHKIGVQVKLHDADSSLPETEWESFLAGCFIRRIDVAIFVTTGCLTGEQGHEASARGVIVISGVAEIARIADLYDYSLRGRDNEAAIVEAAVGAPRRLGLN